MDTEAFAVEIVRLQLQLELKKAEANVAAARKKFGVLDTRFFRAAKAEFDLLARIAKLDTL